MGKYIILSSELPKLWPKSVDFSTVFAGPVIYQPNYRVNRFEKVIFPNLI
jgi:hypothetical protein